MEDYLIFHLFNWIFYFCDPIFNFKEHLFCDNSFFLASCSWLCFLLLVYWEDINGSFNVLKVSFSMHGLCFLQAALFCVTALPIFVLGLGLLRGPVVGVVALGLLFSLGVWHEQWAGASCWADSWVGWRKCHSTCFGVENSEQLLRTEVKGESE